MAKAAPPSSGWIQTYATYCRIGLVYYTSDDSFDYGQLQSSANRLQAVRERDDAVLEERTHTLEWAELQDCKVDCMISTHVDDLKGGATPKVNATLRKHLESQFGECKIVTKTFVHSGIKHIRSSDTAFCHQVEYTGDLQQVGVAGFS